MDLIKLHVCSLYNESLQIHSETHHLHIILEHLRREKEKSNHSILLSRDVELKKQKEISVMITKKKG